jgi:hypothetical protein
MAAKTVNGRTQVNRFERGVLSTAQPESNSVVARSGEQKGFGSAPAAFLVRVDSLSAWTRPSTADAYTLATAFVEGQFDVDGDFILAIRWWQASTHQRLA